MRQQTRQITFKVINSPTLLLPQWHALLEQDAPCAFHGRSLPRDVSTRWNSTYDHLVAFLQLQVYVDKFASVREHGLREFELTEEEWDCLRQLVRVLQVCCMFLHLYLMLMSLQILKEGMEFFSSSTPPVSSVVPVMDTIDCAFTTASMGDDDFSLPIKVALELGKRILNKYYNFMDESEIYRLSISMYTTITAPYWLTCFYKFFIRASRPNTSRTINGQKVGRMKLSRSCEGYSTMSIKAPGCQIRLLRCPIMRHPKTRRRRTW